MTNKINWISELDKFVTNYFKDVDPFEVDNKPIFTDFFLGSVDNKSISEILTDVGDITYPVLIINKDISSNNFSLINSRNVPQANATRISFRQFVKDKYINNEANNINVEIYRYYPPVHFKCQYQITFFCEYLGHANEFQMQFLNRINQVYYPIKSERFASAFFSILWFAKEGIQMEDNYVEGTVKKREIKVTVKIDGEGYFMSLDTKQVVRGISTFAMNSTLR